MKPITRLLLCFLIRLAKQCRNSRDACSCNISMVEHAEATRHDTICHYWSHSSLGSQPIANMIQIYNAHILNLRRSILKKNLYVCQG